MPGGCETRGKNNPSRRGEKFLMLLNNSKGHFCVARTSETTVTHTPLINSGRNCWKALAHETWLTFDDLCREEHCDWRPLCARRLRHKWFWWGVLCRVECARTARDGGATEWGWEAQFCCSPPPPEVTQIIHSAFTSGDGAVLEKSLQRANMPVFEDDCELQETSMLNIRVFKMFQEFVIKTKSTEIAKT